MVLFVMLCEVVSNVLFESVDEIIWCDHSKETSLRAVSHGNTSFSLLMVALLAVKF